MTKRRLSLPPKWTSDEFEQDRQQAISRFVHSTMPSWETSYEKCFDRCYPIVWRVLEKLNFGLHLDLLGLDEEEFNVLRFLSSPHLSQDNYKTLLDTICTEEGCDKTDAALSIAWATVDRRRFPWIDSLREPSDTEKVAVARWTAGIWASQLAQTENRNRPSKRQEHAVREVLKESGYDASHDRGGIVLASDLPIGEFRQSETIVAGTKCDVPVRLRDGRLMLIECKVSNSSTNSTKRLIREVCGKADTWRRKFGDEVVLAVVLEGVFSLLNLEQAQNEYGEFIFWESRLEVLSEYLEHVK